MHAVLPLSLILASFASSVTPQEPASTGPAAARAAAAPTSQPATLSEFTWLAGRWTGPLGRGRLEDIWSAPDGGLIMGMFRMIGQNDTIAVVELSVIRQAGTGVVLEFRHFSAGLEPWEQSKNPLTLWLVDKSPTRWVWQNADPSDARPTMPHRVTWELLDPDTLRSSVDVIRDGSEKRILESEQRRAPARSAP